MNNYWRFIPYAEHTAAYNMAADEAILNAHLAGLSPPTLRIYGFSPPALSLGANQKLPLSVMHNIQSAGFDIVRRPSGGRAVLHLGDLTYSFIGTSAVDKDHVNHNQFLFPSVSGAYRQICHGLILAFKQLGLTLEFGGKQSHVVTNCQHDCFATTTSADLHIHGLKVIGSAQLRRKAAVLQHGSMILRQDANIIRSLLQQTTSSWQTARHANICDLLGYELSKQELETCILQGFQDAFGVSFVPGQLSDREQKEAAGFF
jgi:lipoate-protein ligase A